MTMAKFIDQWTGEELDVENEIKKFNEEMAPYTYNPLVTPISAEQAILSVTHDWEPDIAIGKCDDCGKTFDPTVEQDEYHMFYRFDRDRVLAMKFDDIWRKYHKCLCGQCAIKFADKMVAEGRETPKRYPNW